MEKHGLWSQNQNGELFVDLCAKEDMVIGGKLFPHNICHKVTWISLDYITENQIDHFAISRKWRSLRGVRNKRGADIGSDIDLVVDLFKLKVLASHRKFQTCAEKLNIENSKQTEIKNEFRIKLQNKYQQLQRTEDQKKDIEDFWNEGKSVLIKTTEEVIGYREKGRKEWMSNETWNTIKQRREEKIKLNMAKMRQQKRKKPKSTAN
jgi:hypothetical protein